MPASKGWFVEQRVSGPCRCPSLLTRFPVTVTREANAGRGPDLRVVVELEKPGLREFAVEVKGTTRIRDLVDDRDCICPHVLRAVQRMLGECPFPVALLVFDVATDAGFFGWVLAPVVRKGKAGLVMADTVSVDPATNERIAEALSQIREWYAARPWRMDKTVAHYR
jgi:hypothetical protein